MNKLNVNTRFFIVGVLSVAIWMAILLGINYLANRTSKNQDIATNIKYEILDSSVYTNDKELKEWIEANKKREGITVKKNTDNSAIVLISGGERKTGGYGIGLKGISENNGVIEVDYEVISPSKNDIVTQAITYPIMLVKIDNVNNKEIKVKHEPLKN